MANGFEKLEKLFGGSRRKERSRRRASQQKKVLVVPRQSFVKSSPIFPSPSYLRPMSMHMMPREAQVDGYEKEKARSQSVPDVQEEERRCFSIASSITVVDNAHVSDHPSRSASRRTKKSRDSHMTPVQSRFRFPEDSLFKNDELGRVSGETTIRGTSSEASPCSSHTATSTRENGLLDWTPKHISLLFDPLDLNMPFHDQVSPVDNNTAESLLLPSPIFITSIQPAAESNSIENHDSPIRPVSRQPEDKSFQTLDLSPMQRLLSLSKTPHVKPPPPSHSGADTPTVTVDRSMSLSALPSPDADFSPRTPTEATPNCNVGGTRRTRSVRETWGNRTQDPTVASLSPRSGDSILRSRLVRKSASIATLSLVTSQIIEEHTLKEPTFDDFYALSDDDIAESRPMTPFPNMCTPPTPPPKDNTTDRQKKRFHRKASASSATQRPTTNSATGQITPPCTPTDPQLLPLTCSPASPRDALGAILAAELATKYNFAVVFVVSLWPGEGGDYLDPSRRIPLNSLPYKEHGRHAPCYNQNSKITSRLLAAYGLNEVPYPFPMITDIPTNILNYNDWFKYHNSSPSPRDITEGWIRPYRRDYVPISSPVEPSNTSAGNDRMNRGIVFAAYVKKDSNSALRMRSSRDKNAMLERLNNDAKALVDVLMDNSLSQ